ncbi:MAG: glycoside hydrolase family 16 protein [Alphaproteobacteria bacterium]|nr:glycoside hydrolase family 16 protein [Alphaproteobacteria bacterium]MBU2270771.1 glycoside hydrolase family 16 protein [Alphaproteobacteria bacterium]MBU2418448.1 glycoside hydrolase family 16 protein [Alphaproteobacteria bacterium]
MRRPSAAPTAAFAALLLAAPAVARAQTPGSPPGHSLVWADEFAVDGLPDPALWTYDTHANRTGWYNNELQYYAADRLENARIADGRLIIEARRERLDSAADHGGQDYASARLLSREGWTYGVFQARAKLPCGRGTWPAIWMLPVDLETWPGDGEIDIMEHVGHRPGVVHGTVHTGRYNHVAGTQRGAEVAVPDACDAFHVYEVRWTPEAVDFVLDGRPYYRFPNERTDRAAWPFDRPFRLILNVAVGGDWGGAEGVDAAAFPQRLEIDWIRVWRAD